jgi:hypothetical protein
MSLIDKLYAGQSNLMQKGKRIKSDGRGGFGGASVNRYSIGMNSFNGKTGIDHFSRAMNGNISPYGSANITHLSDEDVEFDED